MYFIKINKGGISFRTIIIYWLGWFNWLIIRKDYLSKDFDRKEVKQIIKLIIEKLDTKYK